jgi:hypothetical protein
MSELGNWSFKDSHVDTDVFTDGRDYISSESMVLCAGGPRLGTDINQCRPIGVVEGVQFSQSKQVQQLYEIGSRESYVVPGRVRSQVGLSRVLFNGPSLLKSISWFSKRFSDDPVLPSKPGQPWPLTGSQTPDDEGKYFGNLYSDFFNRPMGLALIINDSEDERYGGLYLENAYITSHQMSLQAGQTVVMENASVLCTNVVSLAGGAGSTSNEVWPLGNEP